MQAASIPTAATLATRRLVLRYPKLDDAAAIFSVVKSPQFPERLPLKEMDTVSAVEAWLSKLQENWAAGQGFSWIAEECDSGKMTGQVTLAKIAGEQVWALAFWTHPDFWGKGYATEAAERLLAFGFDELGAQKIWAGVGEWNKGSIRVLEKIGLQHMRDNPKGYYSRDKPIASREYEISQEEWQARTRK
jgi:[ribosomal protein S5]-alanine N-acetyltransferase